MRELLTRSMIGASAVAVLVAGCTRAADNHDEQPMASAFSINDQWAAATDGNMAAVFGTLSNNGHHEARIVSGDTPAAERVEVHEVVGDAGAKTMRPKDGGIAIPAGGTHELVPGGDHLMFMDLTGPLSPGSDVDMTVVFEDGSQLPVTVQIRDFAGANENYQPHSNGHG